MAARPSSSCRCGCPHAALIPIYWDLARPVRLPLPIIHGVNASDHRFGGFGLTSASEENILCYRTDRWRGYDGDNVMVHEFAHSIMNLGIVPIQPDFLAKLSATYDAAVAADLWLVPSPPPTYMNTGRKASNHISTPISIPPTQYTITLIPEKNFGNTIPGCSSF